MRQYYDSFGRAARDGDVIECFEDDGSPMREDDAEKYHAVYMDHGEDELEIRDMGYNNVGMILGRPHKILGPFWTLAHIKHIDTNDLQYYWNCLPVAAAHLATLPDAEAFRLFQIFCRGRR